MNNEQKTEDENQERHEIESLVESFLKLEYIDENLYRSVTLWKPFKARGVYGGQVIGQALSAATKTVPSNQKLHSLHSYFILPGDSSFPILYHVTLTRNGRSYATRTVTATQKSRCIFILIASFAVSEQEQLEHQDIMPKVPDPESLPSIEERYEKLLQSEKYDKKLKSVMRWRIQELKNSPMEVRNVDPNDTGELIFNLKAEKKGLFWFKARGNISGNEATHQCVLAYMSDRGLIGQAARATGLSFSSNPGIGLMVSLDHSMWFHSDFHADEWLLYEVDAHRVNNGRGFCTGKVWNRSGQLVVSVAQEGVIRMSKL